MLFDASILPSDLQRWVSLVSDRLRAHDDETADQIAQLPSAAAQDRVTVAVLGKAKRGKSTLINAVLGRRDDLAAPIDRLPASNAISCFCHGPREEALVTFEDDRRETVGLSRVRDFVTEEGNPANRRRVRLVEVSGPFPNLAPHVTIVDTPGAGSVHEHHDALLYRFIPSADAVVVLVTARMPLDQDEVQLLEKIKQADIRKVFFAINQIDLATAQDLDAAERHNADVLHSVGISVERFYRISAKRAYQGDLQGSGVPELAHAVAALAAESRAPLLRDRLVSRVRIAAQPVVEALALKIELAGDSAETIDSQLEQLQSDKLMLATFPERSRRFSEQWSRAIDDVERRAILVRDQLHRDVQEWIEQAGTLNLDSFARDLPGRILAEWNKLLQEPLATLERSLAEARTLLEVEIATPQVSGGKTQAFRKIRAGGLEMAWDMAKGAGWVGVGLGLTQIPGYAVAAAGGTGILASATSLAMAPLVIALGPIAAIVAGAGAVTAFQGWRLSRQRLRDRLAPAAREHIDALLNNLRHEILPTLRRAGESATTDALNHLEQRRRHLVDACSDLRRRRPSESEVEEWRRDHRALTDLLNTGAERI